MGEVILNKLDFHPRVLVISPFFNRAEVVARTLRSISNQTYKSFCAFIWDDASTDETGVELKKFVSDLKDPRFNVFVYPSNVGLTQGLNYACSLGDFEYIAVVGSGDECDPERLAQQVEALDTNPDAVFCGTKSLSIDELTGCVFFDDSFDKKIIKRNDLLHSVPFTHGSVMYRRSKLIQAGLYDTVFKWCADWDLFLRILLHGDGIYIDEPLYKRYARMDGVSFNPTKSLEQIKYQCLVKILSKKSNSEREYIVKKAKENLDGFLYCHSNEIYKTGVKRLIKLILMRRKKQSKEFQKLLEKEYGNSLQMHFSVFIAKLISLLPLNSNLLIQASRAIAARF